MLAAMSDTAKAVSNRPRATYSPLNIVALLVTCGESDLPSEVVGHELVLVAEVEAAVDDDGLGPAAFGADVGGLERSFEVIGGGGGFDKGDFAAAVAEDQIAVGVADGG